MVEIDRFLNDFLTDGEVIGSVEVRRKVRIGGRSANES